MGKQETRGELSPWWRYGVLAGMVLLNFSVGLTLGSFTGKQGRPRGAALFLAALAGYSDLAFRASFC